MAQPHSPIDGRQASWKSLFGSARRAADIRLALDQQLARWAEARGLDAAALYGSGTGTVRRVADFGGRFPDHLDFERTQSELTEAQVIELPSAKLVIAGAAPSTDDPDVLLLSAGVRILELERQLEDHHFQARFRNVEFEALHEVGLAIAATLELESLGAEVIIRAVSLLDARVGALYLIDASSYRLLGHFGGEAEPTLAVDDPRIADLLSGESGADCSIVPGVRHVLAVPIEIESDPRGLLLVADKESRTGVGPFPDDDKRTLALFANQAAIALENAKLHRLALEKERLEREMELASEIQQRLLPKSVPTIEGYEVFGWNRPARQVGGDYFDMRNLEGERWLLVVGDVTGKGVPAALMVSTLHTALHLLGQQMEIAPDMVARLNRHIFESSSSNKFITMLLAELCCDNGTLRYLNAGHNPGVVVRADGSVETMPSGGMPLGLVPTAGFTDAEVALRPGDLACLYSDGITEAAAPDGEEFELDRFQELLIAHRKAPLDELTREIDKVVSAWSAGLPQGDDQTVVLIRRSAE